MKKIGKSHATKKGSRSSMHDRHWKQVMLYAGHGQWQQLGEYIDRYPWLAKAYMGPGCCRIIWQEKRSMACCGCSATVRMSHQPSSPESSAWGARDPEGRGYLERLLAGAENSPLATAHQEQSSPADSPLIAAMVVATSDNPVQCIERMQNVLEQGVQDDDTNRRALAERCIGRSQILFDLLMFLYEHDRIDLLLHCLASEKVLELAAAGKLGNLDALHNGLAAV